MSLDKKKALRKEVLARRNALTKREQSEKSEQIAKRVIELAEFQNAKVILLYEAIKSEVETTVIAQEAKLQNKSLYYPRVQGNEMEFYLVDESTEMEISSYGIKEPKPESTTVYMPKEEDMILVVLPGAVFDRDGNRIGYGGGYYDKYLCWLEGIVPIEQMHKVALAYECQMVDIGMIENEPHDIKVDCVITEIGKWNKIRF